MHSDPIISKIFLHFFDIHFLEAKGFDVYGSPIFAAVRAEARLATRFAILSASEVLLPAASFFESAICFEIINELQELFPSGQLRLVGSGASAVEYIEEKLVQYGRHSIQYKRYMTAKSHPYLYPPFLSRKQSATRDIIDGWLKFAASDSIGSLLVNSNIRLPINFESNWVQVPKKLEGNAFIVENAEKLLVNGSLQGTIRNRLHGVINEQYFNSFTRELGSGIVSDLNYLASTFTIPSYDNNIPFRDVHLVARQSDLLARIESAPATNLAALAGSPEWKTCLSTALDNCRRRAITRQETHKSKIMKELALVKIGIITALPEEFAATCTVLESSAIDVPGQGAGRKYAISKINTKTGADHFIAIAMLNDMGNNSAAIRATLMKQHCPNLEHVIMVGIAGAVPSPKKPHEHVRLGDIVISDRGGVIQYDLDKEGPDIIEIRSPPRPPSAVLLEAVKFLIAGEMLGNRLWEAYIKINIARLGDEWRRPNDACDRLQDQPLPARAISHPRDKERTPGHPRVFHGPIASANKLLKNPVKRDFLREKFGVKAVEMEGSGISDATWNLDMGYLIVRGTCDYCNPSKGDAYHKYAALVAASYTRCILEILAPME